MVYNPFDVKPKSWLKLQGDDDLMAQTKPSYQQPSAVTMPEVSPEQISEALPEPVKQDKKKLDTLSSYFTDENKMMNITLPIIGILETIATQGQSKGETALSAQTKMREAQLYAKKDEELAAEKAEKGEERRRATLLRKKIELIPKDVPDYAKQVAKAKMEMTGEGAVEYEKAFGAKDEALTTGELEGLVKIYGESMRDAILSNPKPFRQNLPMASVTAGKLVETPEQELKQYKSKKDIDLQNQLELKKQDAELRKTLAGTGTKVIGYDDNGVPIYGDKSQRLSQTTVKGMAEFKNFPVLLNDLRGTIETNKESMGPVQGRLQPLMAKAGIVSKGTMSASELNSKYEAVKQVVAKGMEGGVLRKEDMPKYDKILGNIMLQPQFAQQNLDNLEKMLISNYNAYTTGLEASGYYVPPEVKIGQETKTQFNSVQEAESAGLPKGTTIYINGRKAVVE